MDVVADPSLADRRLRTLRGWSIASMVANAALIVTGGLVRLTKSGLGCPTWPKCKESYLPDQALGVHGVIEFANRTLTFVLIALAIVTFVMALRCVGPLRRPAVWATLAIGLGIIAQGIVGGLSVLSHLNPWVVSLHLLLSLALVALCTWVVHLTSPHRQVAVEGRGRLVGLATVAVGYVVTVLGAVVTGSGPNSGDDAVRRNGLDLLSTARVHAAAVWLLVILTVGTILLLRGQKAARMAVGLLVVELLMAAIGYAQYFNGLPFGLVIAHMTGVALFSIALAHLWFTLVPPARRVQRDDAAGRATVMQ